MRGIVAAALGAVLSVGACGSAPAPTEFDLLASLPTQLAGTRLSPREISFADLQQIASGGTETAVAKFITATGADEDSFLGYVVASNLGDAIGAFRVRGASAESLEAGCAALMYSDVSGLTRQDLNGKSVLLVVDNGGHSGGCYVRGNTLYWVGGSRQLAIDFFDALP